MKTDKSAPKNKLRPRSRRGRNPSIDQAKIAAAVREIGSDGDVSMKEVAELLGVNVTTLYRHMGGIEGLQRIRASQLAESLAPPPGVEGHSWQSWLQALAHYYRDVLLANPDLLAFAHAALDPDFDKLEQATAALTGFGFSAQDAALAHGFMINNVIGFVQSELQTMEDAQQGHVSLYARLLEKLQLEPDGLPTLRSLKINEKMFSRDVNFELYVRYMVTGIENQAGAPGQSAKRPAIRT